MSDQNDPFGRNDKTVLRLNPGGRRPAPAPAPTPPPYQPPVPPPYPPQAPPAYQPPPQQPYPAAPPPQSWPQQGQPSPPPPAYGQPQPAPPAYGQPQPPAYSQPAFGGQQDAWMNTPPPPPPTAEQGRQRSLILKRDVPIAANANLLLEAAGPVLLLLGRLRTSLMSADFANLMDQVADAIEEFDKTMRAESFDPAQAEDAKYVMCATCDDIIQNIPSEQRHVWTRYSMLTRFFGERVGGVRFFEKLDKAKQDPTRHYDLLELIYTCLAMGFQGIHRTSAGGAAALQGIQRELYEILRRTQPKTKEDLSPHWRGQGIPAAGQTFRIPMWALGAVAAAGLFAVFLTLRFMLSGNTESVTFEMGRLFADNQLTVERAVTPVAAAPVPVPVKTSTQLERIRARLTEEIAQNKVDPVESGQSIIIRVGSFALFPSGQATVLPTFAPIAEKIAAALEKEPGDIRIVGHTDNVRIVTARFPSNFELSVERARAVAAILKPKLSATDRIRTDGKGDSTPIASNETAEGRAKNRRVEISIPREETLVKR